MGAIHRERRPKYYVLCSIYTSHILYLYIYLCVFIYIYIYTRTPRFNLLPHHPDHWNTSESFHLLLPFFPPFPFMLFDVPFSKSLLPSVVHCGPETFKNTQPTWISKLYIETQNSETKKHIRSKKIK